LAGGFASSAVPNPSLIRVDGWKRAPALAFALAFAGGDFCGLGATRPAPLLAVGLLAAALAARGAGVLPAFFALGWLSGALSAHRSQPPPDVPLGLLVRIESRWSPAQGEGEGPTARAAVLAWRLHRRTGAAHQDVLLEWAPASPTLPEPGSRWRIRSIIQPPTRFANRGASATRWTTVRLKSPRLAERVGGPSFLARSRSVIQAAFDRALPAQRGHLGVALARAMIVGDTDGVAEDILGGFRRSGLAHLLVVSGFNVAVLASWVWAMGSWTGAGWRYLSVCLAALVYLVLVGDQAPVHRACSAAMVVILALSLKRAPIAPQVLGIAALVSLSLEPRWLLELSFQLSYLATAAIVLGAAPVSRGRWLRRLPRPARLALAATLVASLATLPLTLHRFHYANWLSPLYNLLAGPWAAALFSFGLFSALAAAAVPGCAPWLMALLDAIASPATWLATAGPLPGLILGSGSGAWPLAIALAGFAALMARRVIGMAVAVAAMLLLWAGSERESRGRDDAHQDPPPEIIAFDVGQGDATLLLDRRTASRPAMAILVDGGGWRRGDFGGRVLLPALLARGVKRLDVAVASHADRDHCQGLADLAHYLAIDEVWTAPGWEASECMRALRGVAPRSATLVAGDRRQRGRWRFEVLGPRIEDSAGAPGENPVSLVLLAEAGGRRALLTGDLDGRAEAWLAFRRDAGLRADILKVGHHGSAASSSPRFLQAVRPRWAIVSAGRGNLYGHPATATLDRLRGAGARIVRTDREGEIRLLLREPRPSDLPGAAASASGAIDSRAHRR
jgi:competence protein ComEC